MNLPAFPDTRSASSFRDPAGRLLVVGDRLVRVVSPEYRSDVESFLASRTARKFRADLVGTRLLDKSEGQQLLAATPVPEMAGEAILLEHERIPFASFPYEWPPEMLHAAAKLTLQLAETLVEEGLGLKDATPYNILFRGPRPVFIDVLSAERRDPSDPTWLAYAQFTRTFLLPLLVNKHFGLSLDKLFTSNRDGLEPEEVYRMCDVWRKLRPSFLMLASLPTWLGARAQDKASLYEKRKLSNREQARYVLRSLFKRLRRQLQRLEPARGRQSTWSRYTGGDSYTEEGFEAKRGFVESVLAEFRPRNVLDVGCNTGRFSALAATKGARVVAIDADAVAVGECWRRARSEELDILPLVVNLARPSPGLGWRNRECAPFLERVRGKFDALLMLAVLHHVMVSEGIPLEEVLELACDLTTDLLVLEYVNPTDKMFRRIARGRDYLYTGLTREGFEAACRKRFHLVRAEQVPGADRWLYCLRKRNAHDPAS